MEFCTNTRVPQLMSRSTTGRITFAVHSEISQQLVDALGVDSHGFNADVVHLHSPIIRSEF